MNFTMIVVCLSLLGSEAFAQDTSNCDDMAVLLVLIGNMRDAGASEQEALEEVTSAGSNPSLSSSRKALLSSSEIPRAISFVFQNPERSPEDLGVEMQMTCPNN